MEEWTSAVKIAVVSVLLVLIISIVMRYVYIGYRSSEQSSNVLSSQVENFSNSVLEPYNNSVVSGVDVLTCIEQFNNQDISISIEISSVPVTVSGPIILPDKDWEKDAYYHYSVYSDGKLKYTNDSYRLYDVYDEYYINPTSKYESALCKKKDGTIIGICFYKTA